MGPIVVKIGGSTLGDADTTFRDISTLARQGRPIVVVHGGGAEASRWLDAMDIPSRFEDGLRVTDEAALPVIVAVYAGLLNKRIVAALNAAGAPAVGLSGADGRLLGCDITRPELGFVGEPSTTNASVIEALLAAGLMPVVAPVGYVVRDGPDQLVNVNADTVAVSLAGSVAASHIVFLTDVAGVQDGAGAVVPSLTHAEVQAMVQDGTISGGMIPKVRGCLDAVAAGVSAQIVDGRVPGALLELEGRGTLFPTSH